MLRSVAPFLFYRRRQKKKRKAGANIKVIKSNKSNAVGYGKACTQEGRMNYESSNCR